MQNELIKLSNMIYIYKENNSRLPFQTAGWSSRDQLRIFKIFYLILENKFVERSIVKGIVDYTL